MVHELIDIKVALAERVSVAFHQNAVPIASEFAITPFVRVFVLRKAS